MQSSARRRPPRLPYDHGEPIWRCRFDVIATVVVMALAMCVWVSAPGPTHAIVFQLPVKNPLGEPLEPWPGEVLTHLLTVSPEGAILWDGEFIDQGELVVSLAEVAQSNPRSGLIFEPEAHASYDLVARIMSVLVASGATDERFCLGGLQQYANVLDESRMRQPLTSIYIAPEDRMLRVDRETMVGCEEAFH